MPGLLPKSFIGSTAGMGVLTTRFCVGRGGVCISLLDFVGVIPQRPKTHPPSLEEADLGVAECEEVPEDTERVSVFMGILFASILDLK